MNFEAHKQIVQPLSHCLFLFLVHLAHQQSDVALVRAKPTWPPRLSSSRNWGAGECSPVHCCTRSCGTNFTSSCTTATISSTTGGTGKFAIWSATRPSMRSTSTGWITSTINLFCGTKTSTLRSTIRSEARSSETALITLCPLIGNTGTPTIPADFRATLHQPSSANSTVRKDNAFSSVVDIINDIVIPSKTDTKHTDASKLWAECESILAQAALHYPQQL